jgi:spermidine synthase
MSDTMEYIEDLKDEFGVTYMWHDVKIRTSIKTQRGTQVDIIERPGWDLTCYMDNSIQSCIRDEAKYHEALVHPAMSCVKEPKRVCIIGGGEGATAREVLKFPGVEHVDMIEWDEEVVELFKNKYPQWAQGAWNDPRLHVYYEDVFVKMTEPVAEKYDVVIIDLFDPTDENLPQYLRLIDIIMHSWLNQNGSIVLYAGMKNILLEKQYTAVISDHIYRKISENQFRRHHGSDKEYNSDNTDSDSYSSQMDQLITAYGTYIQSFSGVSNFILIHDPADDFANFNKVEGSHLNNLTWDAYRISYYS